MKKGFTLVELLAVITILGIVATITVPIVSTSISESKNKAYDRQKDLITSAARSYMSKNASLLPKSGSYKVLVSTLKNDGFLENKSIKNPKNGSSMDSGFVCVSYSSKKYTYIFKESGNC